MTKLNWELHYPGKLGIIIPLFNKPTIAQDSCQATPQKYEEMPGRTVWKFLLLKVLPSNPPSCKQEAGAMHRDGLGTHLQLFCPDGAHRRCLLLSTGCRMGMLTAHGSWDRTQCFSVHMSREEDRKNHSWGHEMRSTNALKSLRIFASQARRQL